MRFRRGYLSFGVLALALVVLGYFSLARSGPGPYARPLPGSRWTQATTEPDLRVYLNDRGTIETMEFERYLEGVVAAEMNPSWPPEALKAQAIVARTFTIEQLERRGGVQKLHPGADVSTDPEEFQAYNASAVTDAVRQAVRETRGVIIIYRGRPIRAWFHSDAGGQTATPSEGLGSNVEAEGDFPYLSRVRTPWSSPDSEWTGTFTLDEIRAAAAKVASNPGPVTRVSVGRKGPSGRALELVVNEVSVPAPEFRLALGRTRMKSTLITSIEVGGDRVVMRGKGNGHGVGLAQWAAKAMAEEGRTAWEIIQYFYRGVRLAKLWP